MKTPILPKQASTPEAPQPSVNLLHRLGDKAKRLLHVPASHESEDRVTPNPAAGSSALGAVPAGPPCSPRPAHPTPRDPALTPEQRCHASVVRIFGDALRDFRATRTALSFEVASQQDAFFGRHGQVDRTNRYRFAVGELGLIWIYDNEGECGYFPTRSSSTELCRAVINRRAPPEKFVQLTSDEAFRAALRSLLLAPNR